MKRNYIIAIALVACVAIVLTMGINTGALRTAAKVTTKTVSNLNEVPSSWYGTVKNGKISVSTIKGENY